MKKNMGIIDRSIRVLVAVAFLVMYYEGAIGGTLATVGLIISGVFILTSFINFCPLYALLKISTNRKKASKQ